jgi:hypothetical protein
VDHHTSPLSAPLVLKAWEGAPFVSQAHLTVEIGLGGGGREDLVDGEVIVPAHVRHADAVALAVDLQLCRSLPALAIQRRTDPHDDLGWTASHVKRKRGLVERYTSHSLACTFPMVLLEEEAPVLRLWELEARAARGAGAKEATAVPSPVILSGLPSAAIDESLMAVGLTGGAAPKSVPAVRESRVQGGLIMTGRQAHLPTHL